MKKAISLSGILIFLAIFWFLASPLFINVTVYEALPSKEELMAMPDKEREQTIQIITEKMASMPHKSMQEKMVPHSPELVKQGTFQDADAIHQGSGKALLYQLEDGSYLLRLENFKVTNGPDLMVYLVKNSNVSKASDVTNGYLSLGDLKGNIGNQNYIIPAGVDISEYNSAVIWCELFGVLFSSATLQAN
ncbi:MAG TPA: DM13 domain-containing protein [Methylophilaceae bacterium]|nr:DM13 domain-containing protein [Methylophilaceae bacterium]